MSESQHLSRKHCATITSHTCLKLAFYPERVMLTRKSAIDEGRWAGSFGRVGEVGDLADGGFVKIYCRYCGVKRSTREEVLMDTNIVD